MPEVTIKIRAEVGLHARPAATLVDMAKEFECDIRVSHEGNQANAKSILQVLSLGAEKGDEITIATEGDDAEAALERLTELVNQGFELHTNAAGDERDDRL